MKKTGTGREIQYASIKDIHLYDKLNETILERKRYFFFFRFGLVMIGIALSIAVVILNGESKLTLENLLIIGVFSGIIIASINSSMLSKWDKTIAIVDGYLKGLKYYYGVELKRGTQESINIQFDTIAEQQEFSKDLQSKINKS